MKSLIFITSMTLFLSFCNFDETSEKFDQVYGFVETSDKNYCDPDSIVGSDCSGGFFYLTKNGYVIYSFSCYGSDTTSYDIGTYELTSKEVVCTFNKKYSFFNGYNNEDDELLPFNPNSGSTKENKVWRIILQKIVCDNYEFGFDLQEDQYKGRFVLSKLSSEDSKIYIKELLSVDELANLWK